ncbi:MAG: hypothetical protein GY861_06670 [bacterium]|nr:hypothetical protein [bacterium]
MDFKLKITSIPYKRCPSYYREHGVKAVGRPKIDRDKIRSAKEIAATTNLSVAQVGYLRRSGWRQGQYGQSYNHIQQFFDDVGHKQLITWKFLKELPSLKDIKKA